jgi:hypothetical protein
VRLESNLSRTALIGLYWKVIGWYVLITVLFSIYLSLSMALVASIGSVPMGQLLNPANLTGSIPLIVLMAVGYLALILVMNVVMRVYLLRDVWARVISSSSVHNIEAASNVTARGELANALGEGFADGLDVAGF